jgi:hypothetical protein
MTTPKLHRRKRLYDTENPKETIMQLIAAMQTEREQLTNQ